MAARFCVSLTHAKDNPDKATVAFVLANAALGSGRETLVFLSTEAVRLAVEGYAADIHEEGFAPLKQLMGDFTGSTSMPLCAATTRAEAVAGVWARSRAPRCGRWVVEHAHPQSRYARGEGHCAPRSAQRTRVEGEVSWPSSRFRGSKPGPVITIAKQLNLAVDVCGRDPRGDTVETARGERPGPEARRLAA